MDDDGGGGDDSDDDNMVVVVEEEGKAQAWKSNDLNLLYDKAPA